MRVSTVEFLQLSEAGYLIQLTQYYMVGYKLNHYTSVCVFCRCYGCVGSWPLQVGGAQGLPAIDLSRDLSRMGPIVD